MSQNAMREDSVPEPSVPFTERVKTVPEFFGIRVNEEPHYEVVERSGDFEIRRYVPRWVAEVTGDEKDFEEFREHAFKRLANYIFGGNERGKKMAMTAPVVVQLTPGANELDVRTILPEVGHRGWTMAFILPSALKQQEIPHPEDSRIKVRRAPEQEYAVFQYSGSNTIEKVREGERKLKAWLAERGDLRALGGFMMAQYDAPFVLPVVKRNEVLIAVQR